MMQNARMWEVQGVIWEYTITIAIITACMWAWPSYFLLARPVQILHTELLYWTVKTHSLGIEQCYCMCYPSFITKHEAQKPS